MDDYSVILRILVVLATSTAGLGAGSLIYFSFVEDRIIYRASEKSHRRGTNWFVASITLFLVTVYLLHLNLTASWLTSGVGMMLAKLCWNFGDGYRYVTKIYGAVKEIGSNPNKLENYIRRANNYREIQDIRAVAVQQYPLGDPRLDELELIIAELWSERQSD